MARKKDYLDHLARVAMFSACSKRELEQIGRVADELPIAAGRELIKEGSAGREFFIIGEGRASVLRRGRKVATLGPGDFFGELSLLARAPRNATVRADTPMRVFVLGQREFNGVLAEAPTLSQKLLVGLARRLHDLDGKV
jgi:CRP-like cAMP-binding protein